MVTNSISLADIFIIIHQLYQSHLIQSTVTEDLEGLHTTFQKF